MKPPYLTQPLGNVHPENKHPRHNLQVTLKGDDGSSWSTGFELDTKPASPRRFLILELQTRAEKSGGQMVQLSDTQSEFSVRLRGPTLPATIKDLSSLPIKNWVATLYTCFAEAEAVVGILITNRGRIADSTATGSRASCRAQSNSPRQSAMW
jgi:hypothetical protein